MRRLRVPMDDCVPEHTTPERGNVMRGDRLEEERVTVKHRILVLAVSVASLMALTSGSAFAAFTPAPSISAAFVPSSIDVLETSSLHFTITNPNVSGTLTGVTFGITLPSELTVANGAIAECGGTLTLTAAAGTILLTDASVAAGTPCTFATPLITAHVEGYYPIQAMVYSDGSGPGHGTANATLSVEIAAPTIAAAFGAASISVSGTTSLTFTVTNPNAAIARKQVVPAIADPTRALSGIRFHDTLPAGLAVANPNGLTGSCPNGTIGALAGENTITLNDAALEAQASCSFSVTVVGVAVGAQLNGTGPIGSLEGGAGTQATATITVVAADATPTPLRTSTPPPTSVAGSGGPSNKAPLAPLFVLLIATCIAAVSLTLRSRTRIRR
jgi:hypothetical protein